MVSATITIHHTEPIGIDVASETTNNGPGCSDDIAVRYVVDLEFDRAVPADTVVVVDLTSGPTPSQWPGRPSRATVTEVRAATSRRPIYYPRRALTSGIVASYRSS